MYFDEGVYRGYPRHSLSAAGDVNNDGLADFLIGAIDEGTLNLGAAYVVLGSSTWSEELSLSNADTTFLPEAGTEMGHFVGAAGDVNGDSHDDVLIGASVSDQGAIYLALGSSSGIPSINLDNADAKFLGHSNYRLSAGGGGDINGDGYSDIALGAWGANDSVGAAFVWFGE